jgi:hypothetical protein
MAANAEQTPQDAPLELSIAMDTSWVPYCFVDKGGEVNGIIRNILDAAAENVNIHITYLPCASYAALRGSSAE